MGCICSKNSDSSELSYIKKLRFYRFKNHNSKKGCLCFRCFKKKTYNIDKNEVEKQNVDGIDLVRVTLPSVKINDLETPIEKLKKSFSGVYMRDKGLNTFINNNYIVNENTDNTETVEVNKDEPDSKNNRAE